MNLRFTPKDFETIVFEECSICDHAAEIANARLEQWLEDAEIVYGGKDTVLGKDYWHRDGSAPNTHRARLVCIEEIEK